MKSRYDCLWVFYALSIIVWGVFSLLASDYRSMTLCLVCSVPLVLISFNDIRRGDF